MQDCLNKDEFDAELPGEIDPYSTDFNIGPGHEHGHGGDPRVPAFEHPCIELKKMLSSGTFYYSVDFDLTNRLQDR